MIVVDGWEQAWKAARHLSGDEAFEGGAWKWIIVAESLPLECLPAGRLSPSAVFLEKPFNPKEFPSFLLEVVESREIPEEREPPEPLSEEISLPLTPGESYQEPEGARPCPRLRMERPEVCEPRFERYRRGCRVGCSTDCRTGRGCIPSPCG